MTARFHCEATFSIPSRHAFVLTGEVVEGVVRPGMTVHVPVGGVRPLTRAVSSVEIVCTADKQGRVGLVIQCTDARELQALRDLNIHDTDCVVSE